MTTFATVGRLERLRDHREAELFYNSVTPIRGREYEVRPLGARRDADQYQIIKGEGYYAARLYNTDCVKFLPNGEVVVSAGGYNTALTMQFISKVLGIGANRQRGSCVYLIGQEKYITKGKEELRIRHIGNGQYEILSENKHFQYVINRTGANSVRKRTANFRGYLRGFISLRTQEVTKWSSTHELVCVPVTELAAMFGTTVREYMNRDEHFVNYAAWQYLTDKRRNADKFYEASRELDRLITSDNTEDYYRAALILFARASNTQYMRMSKAQEMVIHAAPDNIVSTLDEAQFKLYAKDVLTLTEVKQGKVPNVTYDSWADINDSMGGYDKEAQGLVIKG